MSSEQRITDEKQKQNRYSGSFKRNSKKSSIRKIKKVLNTNNLKNCKHYYSNIIIDKLHSFLSKRKKDAKSSSGKKPNYYIIKTMKNKKKKEEEIEKTSEPNE
ncbi:hypothetical protein C7E23_14035 [Elizabethkingia anophelis]|nr:hypothetical protein C7E23_14035 [Elizabethkingia anophelis]